MPQGGVTAGGAPADALGNGGAPCRPAGTHDDAASWEPHARYAGGEAHRKPRVKAASRTQGGRKGVHRAEDARGARVPGPDAPPHRRVVEIQHLDPGTMAARRPQQHGKKAQTAQELWTPVAVAAVGKEQTAGEEPAELRLLYQNAGG